MFSRGGDVMAGIVISGLDPLLKNFKLTQRDMRTLARTSTHTVARMVTKRAKRLAPRDEGTMRKAIKTKRRRERSGMFRSDTIVNVGASRKDPKGAFYWHMVEYGTLHQNAQPFIGPALKQIEPEADRIFREDIVKRAIKRAEKRRKK